MYLASTVDTTSISVPGILGCTGLQLALWTSAVFCVDIFW